MESQGKPKEAERYESPECWRLTREQLLNGTAEDFARWRAEAAAIEGRNAERLRMRSEAKQEIEALVLVGFGVRYAVWLYRDGEGVKHVQIHRSKIGQ